MSAEFWAVIGMGITILATVAATNRETNRRIDELSRRVDDLAQRLSRLEGEFAEMKRWSQDLVNAVIQHRAA